MLIVEFLGRDGSVRYAPSRVAIRRRDRRSVEMTAPTDPAESPRPVALVTGAAGGIGTAITCAFHDAGWIVYATDIDEAGLGDLASGVGDGSRLETARLDVTAETDRERVIERVEREVGRLDCLVANAGYAVPGAVLDADETTVRESYDVLVHGPTALVRAAFPLLRADDGGRVVTITSSLAEAVFPGTGHYAAAKAAAKTTTQTLRAECRNGPVTAVTVEPAWVDTDFADAAADRLPATADRTSEFAETYRFLDDGRLLDGGPVAVSPDRVAATVLRAASADRPRATYRVGWPATALTLLSTLPTAVAAPLRDQTARVVTWLRSRLD
jgi:NAD(P)-dependent dehydrogenase (short-subunit alcohol dehydrogenase family)